jgi:hypothetical protein
VTKATRDPLAAAIAALDVVGDLDTMQAVFCRAQADGLSVSEHLAWISWVQTRIDADRKTAIRKLKAALDPIPFKKLPADLLWVRGQAEPPCYVSTADRKALADLIGPDVFEEEEEATP